MAPAPLGSEITVAVLREGGPLLENSDRGRDPGRDRAAVFIAVRLEPGKHARQWAGLSWRGLPACVSLCGLGRNRPGLRVRLEFPEWTAAAE
jgi:hypothetical protein